MILAHTGYRDRDTPDVACRLLLWPCRGPVVRAAARARQLSDGLSRCGFGAGFRRCRAARMAVVAIDLACGGAQPGPDAGFFSFYLAVRRTAVPAEPATVARQPRSRAFSARGDRAAACGARW